MNPWEWDPKGCHWYNKDTGETLTPQQVWDMLADVRKRLEAAENDLKLEAQVSTARGYQAIELGKRLEAAEKVCDEAERVREKSSGYLALQKALARWRSVAALAGEEK